MFKGDFLVALCYTVFIIFVQTWWNSWDGFCFKNLRQQQTVPHFADVIFKCIFLNENVCILIGIWLKFVCDNKSALVQVMAWCQTGNKASSPEEMMTHFADSYTVYITRPKWDEGHCHFFLFMLWLAMNFTDWDELNKHLDYDMDK